MDKELQDLLEKAKKRYPDYANRVHGKYKAGIIGKEEFIKELKLLAKEK